MKHSRMRMNAKRAPWLCVVIVPLVFCVSSVNADELDAGYTDPAPPFAAPPVPAGLYLVTDVYAGDVVASSGNTTTYSTVTVPDSPGTYARVIDVVGSGTASQFDDRSFNGRARLSDGRSIAGTYYEDFVLTGAGFVSVNIVFFQDDSESRSSTRPSSPPPSDPTASPRTPPSASPATSVAPRPAPSATPGTGPGPQPPAPTALAPSRMVIATAGVALAPDGPVIGSIEILRGRTIVLWPRAFADGLAVPVRAWRLVSGSADLLGPLSGSASEGCAATWLAPTPGGIPTVMRFEVISDALPGRVMTASVSVIVRSPALMQ